MDWNNHFATLIRDYLRAAPEDERWSFRGLQITGPTDTEVLDDNCLQVTCERQESNHSRIFAGLIRATLKASLSEGGDEAEVLAERAGAVGDYLSDETLWAAFIQGLTLERRTGWAVLHKVVEPSVDEERGEAEHDLSLIVMMRLRSVAKR